MTVFTLRRILLAVACVYALYMTWFTVGRSALSALPHRLISLHDLMFDRYLAAALVFPCCLIAAVPRRGYTISLWACCMWLIVSPFGWKLISPTRSWYSLGLFGNSRTTETICILILPVFVQAISELRRAELLRFWDT